MKNLQSQCWPDLRRRRRRWQTRPQKRIQCQRSQSPRGSRRCRDHGRCWRRRKAPKLRSRSRSRASGTSSPQISVSPCRAGQALTRWLTQGPQCWPHIPFCASGRSAHGVEDSVSNSGAAMSECLELQQLSLERSLFLISNDPVGRNFLFNNQ